MTWRSEWQTPQAAHKFVNAVSDEGDGNEIGQPIKATAFPHRVGDAGSPIRAEAAQPNRLVSSNWLAPFII
jgi:hypothetical protein